MKRIQELSIAVLVSTLNQRVSFVACIQSILTQTRLPNHLIIVETACDGLALTRRDVRSMFPNSVRITWKRMLRGNIAASRNLAVRQVSEDIILFVDDDVILHRTYIKKLLQIYKTNIRVDAVAGRIYPAKNEYWQLFIARLITAAVSNPARHQVVAYWPTLNLSIRTSVLQRTGITFNTYYDAFEDIDYCLRLGAAGCKINYIPSLYVWHMFKRTLSQFLRSYVQYFEYVPRLNADHSGAKLMKVNIFEMGNGYLLFRYVRLIKRMFMWSDALRKTLHLPVEFFFACLMYYYALYKGYKRYGTKN